MAKTHGKNARIYVDEYNFSGYANAWGLDVSVDTAEVTTFTDAAKEYLEGHYGFTLNWTGLYEPDTYDSYTFADAITNGGSHYVALLPLGATAGYAAYEAVGKYTAREIPCGIAEAIGLNHTHQGTGGLSRGQVLAAAAYTEDTQSASIDYGAKAAGETLVVTYRVLAYDGLDSIVLTIQESSDDGSGDAFADIAATESSSFTAIGVERKTATDATEQYLRLDADVTGTGSATVLVTITTLNT